MDTSSPTDTSPNESSPLVFINSPAPTPPAHVTIDLHPPDPTAQPPPRFTLFSILLLPGRLAVGAISYLAGTTISKRAGLSCAPTVFTGCVSVLVGQIVVSVAIGRSRKRRENSNRVRDGGVQATDQMAWLDAIQAVGKIVDTFSDGLRGPAAVKHLFLDTSLVRLLHVSLAEAGLEAAERRVASPEDALVRGRYYLDYALSTYGFVLLKLLGVMDPSYNALVEGTRGVDVARYMLRLRKDQIVVSCLDGEGIKVPRHFVAVDEQMKTVVVAIRGTNSISDIITDLLCDNIPFCGGVAHGGMKEAADALFAALLPTLRTLLHQRPSYSIVLTGHSLGAGVAILLTKVLLINGFTDVKCYAIAPCPVFGPLHAVDADWSDALECFVHGDDLVSKLCLASARSLVLELERIDALNLSPARKKEMIRTNDMTELDRMLQRAQRSLKDPRQKHVEQLYIPSHSGVHWLIPEKRDGPAASTKIKKAAVEIDHEHLGSAYMPTRAYSSYVVRPRMFERLLITPSCVSAHFPSGYTAAFASLDLPPQERRLPTPAKPNFQQMWYASELG